MSPLTLHSLSPVLGVEVRGVDLGRAIDEEGGEPPWTAEVHAAWLTHHLVLFRDQALSPGQHASVAGWFGPIERATPQRLQQGRTTTDPAHYISNRVDGGQAGDGELRFHSDSSTRPYPLRAITLFAVDVPAQGGDTLYANCVLAYRQLPAALKKRLHDVLALHGYDYTRLAKTDGTGDGFSAVHPVAMSHPLTGEPVLYVSRNFTHHIVGWPEAASEDLLEELWSFVESDRVIYRHRWQAGDLIIWDNIALQHARSDFDPSEARTLQRVTVSGAPASLA